MVATAAIVGSQTAKTKPAGPSYDVEFRLRVAPGASKFRIVQWAETLKEVGVASVNEQAEQPALGKKPTVAEQPIELVGNRRIVVRASVDATGALHIAGSTFRAADRERLATLVKRLGLEGMPAPDPSDKRWGLNQANWELLLRSLRPPGPPEINDAPLPMVLDQMSGRCKLPIRLTESAQKRAVPAHIQSACGTLSSGSNLAYALSTVGLAFEPRQDGSGTLSLLILAADESRHPWPVGFVLDEFPGNVAPQLFERTSYATRKTPLGEYLAFLRKELRMEVVLDEPALARRGSDVRELQVTMEFADQAWATTMRRCLAAMGLKHEIRVDEAGRPFVWVTLSDTIGPRPGSNPPGESDVRRK
jgi:hypothetical protein